MFKMILWYNYKCKICKQCYMIFCWTFWFEKATKIKLCGIIPPILYHIMRSICLFIIRTLDCWKNIKINVVFQKYIFEEEEQNKHILNPNPINKMHEKVLKKLYV